MRAGARNQLANSVVVPKGQWKVSVQDMVKSSKKTNDEFGIPGYSYAKYNAHLDKPAVFSISKDDGKLPRDYISMLQRQKKTIPGPIYDVAPPFANKGKFYIAKGNEPTFFGQVQNESKKKPGVGRYNIADV